MKKVISFILFITLCVSAIWGQLYPIPFSHSDSGKFYLNDSLSEYYRTQGDFRSASYYLDQNAMLYWKHNYFDEAIKYFRKSIELNKRIQNYDGIAKINTNLALIYSDKGQFDSAYKYFEKTLSVRKSQNQTVGVIAALINEAVVLNNLGRYQESIKKLEEALSLARELNDMKQMRSCYGMLAETYQKIGNLEKSLYYYNYFKTFNDYLTKKEVAKTRAELEKEAALRKVAELEALNKQLLLNQKKRELSQKQGEIIRLNEEQKRLYDSLTKKEMVLKIFEQKNRISNLENRALKIQMRRRRLLLLFALVTIVLLVVIVVLMYWSYKKQQRLLKTISEKNAVISQQKEELETLVGLLKIKNQEITDSITYALEIQRAIFSWNLKLENYLADYFEIYLPKDIVSGDFIYSSQVNGRLFIAVGDCTGHGVPGAFLSIIGYNLLKQIINEEHIWDAAVVMLELNKRFYQILNQANSSSMDSMDIGLCVIDRERNVLEFAGKNHNLIITRERDKVEVVKGNKYVYDQFDESTVKKFEKKAIVITRNMWFYLHTDGLIHQPNEEFKKFSIKRLKALLGQIHDLPGEEKKEKIMQDLANWWKNAEQIDDITIIGFKVF